MYKTLNNSVAEHIVLCACRGQYRFCAYSLYNHYKADTFNDVVFKHLFFAVCNLLGSNYPDMYEDESIDFCVRDFISRYDKIRFII